MKVKVNGTDQVYENALSISELLKANKVDKPEMVSVQINGEFLDRSEFGSTLTKENDEVDFLYFMGGGQGNVSIEYLVLSIENSFSKPLITNS